MEALAILIPAAISLISLFVTQNQQRKEATAQQKLLNEQNTIAEENVDNNLTIANQNFALSQQQFEYQKQLNELQMQREDTAMQRQVADLKASGLSPLMASGGSTTGQLISGNAPQMDMSGINNAIANLLGVKQDYASRRLMAYQFERQQHLQIAQQFADLTSMKLDNDYKRQLIEGQKITNAYNTEHGVRDPSPQQALVDFAMKYYDEKGSVGDVIKGLKEDIPNIGETAAKELGNLVIDIAENRIDATKELAEKVYSLAGDAYDKYVPEGVKSKVSSGVEKVKNSRPARWIGSKYNATKDWVKKKLGR